MEQKILQTKKPSINMLYCVRTFVFSITREYDSMDS